jgi:hypothetical protein
VGDLLERCAEGQGVLWAWREIGIAIVVAQARRWRPSLGARVARVFWWGITEVAIMLSASLIADQFRHSQSLRNVFSARFIVTLMTLLSIAFVGLRALIKMHRYQRGRTAVHHLIVTFFLMTLGAGTLTWAATVRYGKGQAVPLEGLAATSPTALHSPLR